MQHHKVVFSTGGGFEERFKGYDRKEVVNTGSKIEERTNAYDRDLVVYDTAPDGTLSLVEIHFAYSNRVFVFNQETPQLKAAR